MIKLTLNLPARNRLTFQLGKRRVDPLLDDPILPTLAEIKAVRAGSRVSRIFRHIFEHQSIKRVLGSNLALAIIATSFVPGSVLANTSHELVQAEDTVIKIDQPLTTQVGVQYPVRTVKVNQGYSVFHPGLDLDGVTGDEIRPIKAGKVEAVQYSKFLYGNAVIVDHGDGLSSLYAHLSKILVTQGQEVATFTKIGEMGSTGRSTGDHLHLEIHKNGYPVNPFSILPK